jgi:LDH2 family malate/lactate/ureidoglycolate dehydrogenase
MDGENGLGPVCCNKAMDVAIERASKYGLALVSVRNSNHFGFTAYYSMKALKHDYIGFCTTNGPAVIAPWGGSEPLLSSNPFSCAIPADTEPPVVLDMSCGMVAHTRIRLKARDNLPIPEGWAITKSGEPTTDPREALEGTVLPVGGYKGYGIAVIDEVLSSCLTGALFSFEILQGMVGIDWKRSDFPQPSFRCGHLVAALDPGKLVPLEEFKQRVDRLCITLKASAKAKGFEKIYLPGEIEQELRTVRLGSGIIPLSESTIDMLNSFAKEIGIEGVKSV